MLAQKYIILSSFKEASLNDIGSGYIREFTKHGAIFIDYEDLYLKIGSKNVLKYISDIIDAKGIEVLIYQAAPSDFHFSVELFQLLKEKVFTVMTLGDTDQHFYLKDIYYAQCMDLVVVYDPLSRGRFKQYEVEAITFNSSFDKKKYFKIPEVEKKNDVSFVGKVLYKNNRKEYIDYIIQNGTWVEIFGEGSKNGPVSLEKMVETFNKTKINLSFTGISTRNVVRNEPNINLRLRQMKGRSTEIALCGGFVLSEYAPGIEEVFDVDNEIKIFYSKEELIEKIKYYLEHEDEREAIATAGYERALKDYEISTAIPRLINQIEEIRKRKIYKSAQVYLDNHFVKFYTTFRVAMLLEFIRSRKWRLAYEELSIILKNRKLDFYVTLRYLLNASPRLKEFLKYTLRYLSSAFHQH